MKALKLLRNREQLLKHAKIDIDDPNAKLKTCHRALVTELAGPTSTLQHRQSLAYADMLQFLTRPGDVLSQAVVIDTLGTTQPQLLASTITASMPQDSAGQAQAAQLLDRIQLTRVFNAHGLVETLQEITDSLAEASEQAVAGRQEARIGFLLVSNITNPMSLLIQRSAGLQGTNNAQTGPAPEGHALLVQIMRQLRTLAHIFGVTVVLLNNTVRAPINNEAATTVEPGHRQRRGGFQESAFSEVAFQPALGKTWPHLLDVQLLVHPCKDIDQTYEAQGEGLIIECIQSRIGGVGSWQQG
jgi:hypothetical protein